MISIIKWVLTRILDPIFNYFKGKKEQEEKFKLKVDEFQSAPIEDTLRDEERMMDILNTRAVTKIILHCSDSDIKAHDSIRVIDNWHKAKGWEGCGYHFVITKNGKVEKGRHLEKIGAHAKGHNEDSVGICLTGKYDFSYDQFKSCNRIIGNLFDVYGLEWDDVYLHSEINKNKTCPNFKTYQIKAVSL